jgi:hypothetical protein
MSDTIKKNINDTSISLKGLASYETGKDTVQFLSKYFEKDLCSPGNINHPKYLTFQKKSTSVIAEVKEKIKSILISFEHSNFTENCPAIIPFKEKLGNVDRLNNCIFYPIPYYSLTFNVAERKSTDLNFLKFFSLDTVSIYFKVELVNDVIGIVKYSNNNTIKISCFYPQDSLVIVKMKTLNKNSILIKKDLVNLGGAYQNFGFIDNNNLFMGECYFEEIVRKNDETNETKIIHHQGCDFVPIHDYYLKPSGSGSNLARIIKDGYISKYR